MTANIYELNHFYHAIQSFMDFFNLKTAHLCLKYDNRVIVDLCGKSSDNKDVSYKSSGLDYRIDQFLELEIIKDIFPDFIFVMISKSQSFEDFLKLTRQKTNVIKIQQPILALTPKKEYA
jgi:hypothetical protein